LSKSGVKGERISHKLELMSRLSDNQICIRDIYGKRIYVIFNVISKSFIRISESYLLIQLIGDDFILARSMEFKKRVLLNKQYKVLKSFDRSMTEYTNCMTAFNFPIDIEWHRKVSPSDFKDFFIRAYDLLTDDLIWEHSIDGRVCENISEYDYFIFGTTSNEHIQSEVSHSLYCINIVSGKILWVKRNFNVYNLLHENSDTIIVQSEHKTYRIDIATGEILLSKEIMIGEYKSNISPRYVDDAGILFRVMSNNMADNRFGRLSKETFDIEWMYYYEIEGNKNLFLHDMILLEDGRYLIKNGLQGHERLFIFDPDDPENIPYRGISNGEVTGYSNLN